MAEVSEQHIHGSEQKSVIPREDGIDGDDNNEVVAEGVCRIKRKGANGTGFLGKFQLKDREVHGLFTNNHVINEERLRPSAHGGPQSKFSLIFHFYEDKPEGNENKAPVEIQIDDNTLANLSGIKFTCPILDATFVEFDENLVRRIYDKAKSKGHQVVYLPLKFPEKCDYKGMEIEVTGHPADGFDGTMKYAQGPVEEIKGYNIYHKASTEKGSSGSPIVDATDGKVVAIHKAAGGGEYNIAVAITDVLNALERSTETTPKPISSRVKEKMKQICFSLRFPHKKGNVYSFFTKLRGREQEIWCTDTCHGVYCTLSNPISRENYMNRKGSAKKEDSDPQDEPKYLDDMFDEIEWVPLNELEGYDQSMDDIGNLLKNLNV